MIDIYSPDFDNARKWIRNAFKRSSNWDTILYMNQGSEEALRNELERRIDLDYWPEELNVELWFELVRSEEKAEKEKKELEIKEDKAMLTDKSEDNGVEAPEDRYSSWVLYKNHLLRTNWKKDSIEEMELSTVQTLRRLKMDTQPGGAVKGLVVGHVQSGKTANMAALMAMAADWGWNMFIVLSGTIENLRKQTQDRLFNDLNHHGNIVWRKLEHLSLSSSADSKLQNLNVERRSQHRYFTVCLKNPTRLTNLIKWLQADNKKLEQLKIIVIDDEADQGSINTQKDELRSRINALLVNLVEGNKYNGEPYNGGPKAMNYIGYTATPYANFLNESLPESLYPSSFIRTLKPSSEYFGAKQIFGTENSLEQRELNIIRDLNDNAVTQLINIHDGISLELPEPAIDSLAWYLCAAAAMRLNGYKKPISMLVHTSQKQHHHTMIANAISNWLSQDKTSVVLKCKKVWERETARFTVESFRTVFAEYPDKDQLKDYPQFEEIEAGIFVLLEQISPIPLDDDKQMTYISGIHLCIDNCSNNGINEENMFVRLAYPDPKMGNYPNPAPAFIVVGGSTLSRGLTIEGLVSTLFLRATNQADSLMQMGRWFGYRKGYELYPRVWMTDSTKDKFRFLAQLEQELRDDLRRFMDAGADPSEYGPRITTSPKVSWMRITATNKMQSAVAAEMDFSGTNAQTVVFSEDRDLLSHNIKVTESFLESMGEGVCSRTKNSIVWRNIPFSIIKKGLLVNQYKFHPRSSVFNHIEAFCDWFEKSAAEAEYTDWNVIVAGTQNEAPALVWNVPGGSVGKINRSRIKKKTHDNSLSVGVLRAPKDLFEDIEAGKIDEEEIKEVNKSANNERVRKTREKAGLALTPLLILYRIDKNSKADEEEPDSNRLDLNAPEDIIGISMWIPGVKSKSLVKTVTVKIKKEDIELDVEDEAGGLDEN